VDFCVVVDIIEVILSMRLDMGSARVEMMIGECGDDVGVLAPLSGGTEEEPIVGASDDGF
jgi:hypothetical protein